MPNFLTVSQKSGFKSNYTFDELNNNYIFNPRYDSTHSICSYYSVTFEPGLYYFELLGAKGSGTLGGNGGFASGILSIPKKRNFYLHVGTRQGYNGGGFSTTGNTNGGGASDIRLTESSNFNKEKEEESLRSRIIVAAGGGGEMNWERAGITANGGYGGGLTGGDASLGEDTTYPTYTPVSASKGATQKQGGSADVSMNSGQSGSFGKGGNSSITEPSGAGGGGYYGGAGGSDGDHSCSAGSGGSSFISGHESCQAIDEEGNPKLTSIHYSGLYFTQTKMKENYCSKDGSILIKRLEKYLYLTYQRNHFSMKLWLTFILSFSLQK